MNKKAFNIIVAFLLIFCPLTSFSSTFSEPPSATKLKFPPPKTESEAIKRIPDFIILNTILPPVIDREKLMKQIFGDYTYEVKTLLTKEKIRELSLLTASELKNKKIKLSELKNLILDKLNIKLNFPEHFTNISIPILVAIIVSVVISTVLIFILLIIST